MGIEVIFVAVMSIISVIVVTYSLGNLAYPEKDREQSN